MLHLVTGVPGATKTAFVVTELDKIEKANKVNLVRNIKIYEHNKKLIEKFADDFLYREYEVGSGHEIKNQIDILPEDYFDFLSQEFDDLRPDYYYQRVVHFNEIIDRINNREGEQGFKPFLPVRTIYTNINNLKIDYARALTYDWRDCPDGSIIVIDEVQLVEPYDDVKSKDNPIIQSLTIHRHRGFDFYFITQFPSLLHPTVKVLIGVHFHLTRPYGMKTVVYRYGSAKDNPNALVNKQNVETKFMFNPQQRIFKLYKSTTINTHQKRFPKGILFFLAWVLLAIAFFIYQVFFSDDLSKSSFVNDDKTLAPTQETPAITTTTTPNPQLQEETQSQVVAQDEQKRIYITRQKYLSAYTIEVGDDPLVLPASVMAMNGKCRAYNQYGDLLNIPNKQCLHMLAEKGRIPQRRDTNQSNTMQIPQNKSFEQKESPKQENNEITQVTTTAEEYLFTDKSSTEPIFNN